MTPLKKRTFPLRLSVKNFSNFYNSIEDAFTARDFLYVARFGQANPELRGCALIMLGNFVGGENILNKAGINTPNSYIYRAYMDWQNNNKDEARSWLAKAVAKGSNDPRIKKFEALLERESWRVIFYANYSNEEEISPFSNLNGFNVSVFQHFKNSMTQVFTNAIPSGPEIDLVLVDNLSLMPVGIRDWKAPVVVNVHDCEYQYEFLDIVLPEIDLLSVGSTTEVLELGRAFSRDVTVNYFPLPIHLPDIEPISISKKFINKCERTIDIVHTGEIVNDFYRFKRQEILSLSRLEDRFSIKIMGARCTHKKYWEHLGQTRFSIMASRCCNYMPGRTFDALVSGTLPLVEEENGFPYMFSKWYACFSPYKRETIVSDVRQHLSNYDDIINKFLKELPEFEDEFNSIFSSVKDRTERYLRHLLWMTKVEKGEKANRAISKPIRQTAYFNEYDFYKLNKNSIKHIYDQIHPRDWMRRAMAMGRLTLANEETQQASIHAYKEMLKHGLKENPTSLMPRYTLGLCDYFLESFDDAEKSFGIVANGDLKLDPHDPAPMKLGRNNSAYWMQDARVRMRCNDFVQPLASPEQVIKSYAWSNLADIALRRALINENDESLAIKNYFLAAHSAEEAMRLFSYNDHAERSYIRAAYGLSLYKVDDWSKTFFQSFEIANYNDNTILHDMGAMTIHLLLLEGRNEEAEKIVNDIGRYLKRVDLSNHELALYPESIMLNYRYQIPNRKLKAALQ